MRHQDLHINHIIESFTFANAAARTGSTGYVTGDIGRIAYQTDTGQYWRLTAITPTWQLISPRIGVTVANLPASPTAGMIAYVTDGTAALAWGATVTGGSSTPYLVWYNGTNWTVTGK